MAIFVKNPKAQVLLKDAEQKPLCRYSGVHPQASPDSIALFATGIDMLRNDSTAYTYRIVTCELTDDAGSQG